jgi:DNA modification methylase
MKKEELVNLVLQMQADKTATTVIHEDKPAINDLHPTMKPVKLVGKLIKNGSKEGEKVIDLFGGSGSTLIACEQLNRTAYLMEYEPKYLDVIINRYERLTGDKAELIEE